MSTEHVIIRKAADGTLTTGELRQFLNEIGRACDGHYPESLPVKARVSFSGGIKSMTVTVPGGSEQRDD